VIKKQATPPLSTPPIFSPDQSGSDSREKMEPLWKWICHHGGDSRRAPIFGSHWTWSLTRFSPASLSRSHPKAAQADLRRHRKFREIMNLDTRSTGLSHVKPYVGYFTRLNAVHCTGGERGFSRGSVGGAGSGRRLIGLRNVWDLIQLTECTINSFIWAPIVIHCNCLSLTLTLFTRPSMQFQIQR